MKHFYFCGLFNDDVSSSDEERLLGDDQYEIEKNMEVVVENFNILRRNLSGGAAVNQSKSQVSTAGPLVEI